MYISHSINLSGEFFNETIFIQGKKTQKNEMV